MQIVHQRINRLPSPGDKQIDALGTQQDRPFELQTVAAGTQRGATLLEFGQGYELIAGDVGDGGRHEETGLQTSTKAAGDRKCRGQARPKPAPLLDFDFNPTDPLRNQIVEERPQQSKDESHGSIH